MPHPIPQPMPPRESGYTATTEHPLYWAAYGPASAPKLLILHGGPGADHEYLLPQMLHLSEKYNCYFYDQRGGGKSRVDAHVEVTWQTHVQDIAKIAREFGIDPLSMVGFSWGAMLALLYSLEARKGQDLPMPDRLVLINPAPLTNEYRVRFNANMEARKGKPTPGDTRTPFELAVAGYFANPEMARELTPFRVIGRVQQSVWQSFETSYDLIKQMSPLGVPVLVIHGSEDPIPPESSRLASEALGAQFVLIPNCGHVPYVEAPDELWGAVDPFLAETDKLKNND